MKAHGLTGAMIRSHDLHINPGGDVMGIRGPTCDHEPGLPIDRLLSREELGIAKTVGELEDQGIKPGPNVQFRD